MQGHSLTDLMNHLSSVDFKYLLPEISKLGDFPDILVQKEQQMESLSFIESMQSSVEKLLSDRHPTRYFSFLKAQCDMEIKRYSKKELTKNQFIDFSKQADKHLGEDNYTSSLTETFARSFETFLFSKSHNNYLLVKTYDSDFYAQGQMRSDFNHFWTTAWNQIRIKSNFPPSEPTIKNKSLVLNNIFDFRKKYNTNNTSSKSLKS